MSNDLLVVDNNKFKSCLSKDYNFVFNKNNGTFYRWGKSVEDDPPYAPLPEIADIEISSGGCVLKCPFCYKKNNIKDEPKYMSIDTYKIVLDFLNEKNQLTQVALGITTIDSNTDFWKILKHTKDKGIVPNLTSNGTDITKQVAKRLKKYIGAVSVSVYKHNKDVAFNAIKTLIKEGIKQVNVHFMLSSATYDFAYQVINEIVNDDNLKNINAFVFLSYKHKNDSSPFTYNLSQEKVEKLLDYCNEKKINYGFDSCFAHIYINYIKKQKDFEKYIQYVEPCESSLFSVYVNVEGKVFPCSFLEGVSDWSTGIDLNNIFNFKEDVWNGYRFSFFRKKLLENNRKCVVYDI